VSDGKRIKIVVLDGHCLNPGDNSWKDVEQLGEVVVHPRTPAHEVPSRSVGATVLLTNKTPITRTAIAQMPDLRFISVLATGYNIVDVEAARERRIPVSNVPVYGTASVAQYTMALLLELCHRVGIHDQSVHAGDWTRSPDWCYWKSPHVELAGKTMTIVGFGRIGRKVGELAHAFGMEVLAVDVYQGAPPEYRPFAFVDLQEGLRRADVVSLNSALTKDNQEMINAAAIAKMKPSAFILNAARGQLVNEADLAAALNAGRIGGAALDVVSTEPIHTDNPLLQARNCILTPHNAWASLEARQRLMQTTAENVASFLRGEPRNVVNGVN
jgi:glycerate dehydrogenase